SLDGWSAGETHRDGGPGETDGFRSAQPILQLLLRVPPDEPEPCLHLGDLGAADGNPVRGRSVELDDGAVALLADEADMGNGNDMAAVHPDEQAGVELGFGLRNRPRAHPLAGAVVDAGVMGVGPDAADVGRVDEMRAIGALDRKSWRGRRP